MIPKTIHFCWFGRNPKPQLVQECINSWKTYCPDWEIKEWNEDNFDVNQIQYTADAYAAKKWAFVSDYARLALVYEYGGVYLDTDVLLKTHCLDEWRQYDCWLACDDPRGVATGLGFGAEKGNVVIGEMMRSYNSYTFPEGTNVSRDTAILERVLPEWEKSQHSTVVGKNTLIVGCADYGHYASHLYAYSWSDDESKIRTTITQEPLTKREQRKRNRKWRLMLTIRHPKILAFMDRRKGSLLERIYTFLAYDLLSFGIGHFIKRLFLKIKQKLF